MAVQLIGSQPINPRRCGQGDVFQRMRRIIIPEKARVPFNLDNCGEAIRASSRQGAGFCRDRP